jgi:hypothetical protein
MQALVEQNATTIDEGFVLTILVQSNLSMRSPLLSSHLY